MTEHEFRTGRPDPARSDVITLDETIPPLLWMRKAVPVMALRFLDIAAPAMIRFDRDNLPEWIEQAVEAPQGEPGAIWIEWEWPGKEPGDAARLILHGPTAIEIVEPGSWIVGDADGIRAYSDEEFRAAHETIVSDPPINPEEKTMTTTITVTTHNWPVAVTTHSEHSFADDNNRGNGYSSTSTFVPRSSARDFTISQGTNITIEELPAEAQSLKHFYEMRDGGTLNQSFAGNTGILSGGAMTFGGEPTEEGATD
jgi:hypothetical protein